MCDFTTDTNSELDIPKQYILVCDNKSNYIINIIDNKMPIFILKNNIFYDRNDKIICHYTNKYIFQHALCLIYNSVIDDKFSSVLRAYNYNCPVILNSQFSDFFPNGTFIEDEWNTNITKTEYRMKLAAEGQSMLHTIQKNYSDFLSKLTDMYGEETTIQLDIENITVNSNGIYMLNQMVIDKRIERMAEYIYCIKKNLENPKIREIHIFWNGIGEFPINNDKLRLIIVNKWMTFDDFMKYAAHTLPNKICCLSNLDIYLEYNDFSVIPLNDNQIYCIGRFEKKDDNVWRDMTLQQKVYSTCQDTWLFLGGTIIPNCNFQLGSLYCDIKFAGRARAAGFHPINDANRFRTYHIDNTRNKNGENYMNIIRNEIKDGIRETGLDELDEPYITLPDTIINNISIDRLCSNLELNDDDLYEIRSIILKKTIKFLV